MAKCIEIKPRYIDANEINWQQVEYEYGKRNNTIIACEIAVDETPEADVAPVVHAYNKSKDGFLCSACTFGDFGLFRDYTPTYCPNCGAKMDEVTE